MIASRFTKAFQLIALVLVFSVAQVYVMAGPIRVSTDPKAIDPSTTSQPKSETAVMAESAGNKTAAATAISAASQLLIPGAASERMPLTAGSKTTLNRIFSKRDVEARIATGSTFLKAKASFAESFKSPSKNMPSPQNDSGSDDDKDSRGVWIAVGVIAAVLTIAIIGLRHDRHTTVQ
jgi:hypothetical protein